MNRFIGSKLREAREARNLTALSLADLAGVSPSAISRFEHGDIAPNLDTQSRLAQVLNLPLTFFFQKDNEQSLAGKIFFRSLASSTKAARSKERRCLQWHVTISEYVRTFASLPNPDIPDWEFPDNPRHLSEREIEKAAFELRKYWALGTNPVPNMVELLEDKGIVVARYRFEDDTLDAYSAWCTDGPHIVLGADKRSAVRSRFDAAHELGHLVLHRSIDTETLNNRDTLRRVEQDAHYFAGAFLLPEEPFASSIMIPTLDWLLSLKWTWRVSVSAMVMRLKALDLVSPDELRRLMKAIGSRRWSKWEPYDSDIPIEEPSLLRAALELGLTRGRVSLAGIRTLLPYATTDIEQLAGLPDGYLASGSNPRVSLKDDDHQGKIIQFPY